METGKRKRDPPDRYRFRAGFRSGCLHSPGGKGGKSAAEANPECAAEQSEERGIREEEKLEIFSGKLFFPPKT